MWVAAFVADCGQSIPCPFWWSGGKCLLSEHPPPMDDQRVQRTNSPQPTAGSDRREFFRGDLADDFSRPHKLPAVRLQGGNQRFPATDMCTDYALTKARQSERPLHSFSVQDLTLDHCQHRVRPVQGDGQAQRLQVPLFVQQIGQLLISGKAEQV